MLFPGQLPDFPWDSLAPYRERAAAYDGITADLSIGTPVDPTPQIVIDALRGQADSPGYPPVIGTPELRESMISWWASRGATVEAVLPTVGSKEMVALLPAFLGLGEGNTVIIPDQAYPTYEVGAVLCGASPVAVDPTTDPQTWPAASLVWLNSPGNPHGHVLDAAQLAAIVAWAQENGTIVASDECYAGLPWDGVEVPSVLADEISPKKTGLVALYSLSKQSNMAGYRAAMITGDPAIIAPLTELRKHAGFMVPGPVQKAMAVALMDGEHVAAQNEIYAARRARLMPAVQAAGMSVDPASRAGLYLWVSKDGASCWDIVSELADLGIIVAPGSFYGPAGEGHVRMALTASDEAIDAAVARLTTAQ